MKYEFIETYRSSFTVARMCSALKVCQSGYFRWRSRKPTTRQQEDANLAVTIREIHAESKSTYGATRIKSALERKNIFVSISKVRRLMRENGIYSITRQKHRPYPKTNEETKYSDNTLDRKFLVLKANSVWCGDITYVKTATGWVYLAIVIDLFNREVIGYAASRKPNSELTCRAMAMALTHRKPIEGVMFHSDRGCQYSSKTYQRYLEQHGVVSSMSRTGNPFDNACSESFFANLKKEWIYHKKYYGLSDFETSMFEYIEIFYNRKRLHSSLGNLTPKEFYDKYKNGKSA